MRSDRLKSLAGRGKNKKPGREPNPGKYVDTTVVEDSTLDSLKLTPREFLAMVRERAYIQAQAGKELPSRRKLLRKQGKTIADLYKSPD